ncbi:MAG: Cyclohexanone monooxygenase, partial [Acidimicrobiia bacterium]|nr:Cyclohexanone monooxygenase [Acidimicrobiia bacterium]
GFTQTGITFNYTHAVVEQCEHLVHLLGEARQRGARVLEATADGEAGWVAEMARLAKRGKKYYESCTPGYLTNEGQLDSTIALTAGAYGGGPLVFFDLLEQWRAAGDLGGFELRD